MIGEREGQDLHLLYQACIADLSFFKSQQWSISNYAFLAYGGLFAIGEVKGSDSALLKLFLLVLIIAVGISGVWLVHSLDHAIKVRQARLEFIRKRLTPIFRDAWGVMNKDDKEPEFLQPGNVMRGALVVGMILVALLVARGLCQT